MFKKYILDLDGTPIECENLLEWSAWYEKADRTVAKTKIGDVTVSTVFLSTDHSFNHGPPILYETMIFGGENDQFQERYTTREEAEEGHRIAVELASRSVASRESTGT